MSCATAKKTVVTKKYSCDILELPEYLTQQAGEGLHIKKITPAWLVFEQGEPSKTDYKMIPVNNSVEFDHLKELPGWEPVLVFGEFVLMSAPQGTPFTMAMDKQVTMVKLSFMRTMYIVRFLLAFAGLVFAVAGIAQYAASKPWLAVLSAVLSAALALFGVLELLPLIRLQKSIRRLAGKDA